MKFVADIHLHSHYSRATSKDLNFEHLAKWAQLKGIHLVGTGDISHPGWLQELKDKLEPAEDGLFRLKEDVAQDIQRQVPPACQDTVRFILAGEISSIYKKNDKVRKIHNVIFAPTLEAVEKIQAALEKIGNIRSDGRPILGLDSRDLLEIILDIDEQNYLIPAHIWTPWFSLLGSKSGFDSVEECFEDLTPHIFSLETGLSSDPPMNWRVSALDGYTLVSNSDAHSPQKLAREANVFNTELSYPAFFEALKSGDPEQFLGTIEFFPEEGKYHHDGHRKCGINWNPKITLEHSGLCPICGKPVTVGVSHRVETLADREEGEKPARHHPYQSLIPLPEILGEVYGVGPTSKRVTQAYDSLLNTLGSELSILIDVPLDDISHAGGPLLAEGIRRMRNGEVITTAGYDGEYGIIRVFDEGEKETFAAQLSFFPESEWRKSTRPTAQLELNELPGPSQWTQAVLFGQPDTQPAAKLAPERHRPENSDLLSDLNPQQQEAVLCTDVPLIIVAGPGTGKTRTLTHRVAYLIQAQGVAPENILAITFTNKAAGEMSHRLAGLLGPHLTQQIVIKTFHAFGAMILREEGKHMGQDSRFYVCNDNDRQALLKRLYPDLGIKEINQTLEQISSVKNQLLHPSSPQVKTKYDPQFVEKYRNYEAALQKSRMLDFDDLITQAVNLFETHPDILGKYQQRFRWISVDEYQDINFAQYRLLRLLTPRETNICAIGDPDQAIYGFRGADRTFFLQFQEDFPSARILHLSQNYRSTQLILDASEQVIERSPAKERVKIWSDFMDKTKIEVYQAVSDRAEAEYTVHEIEKMMGGTSYFSIDSERVTDDDGSSARTFADFAVLYRLSAQSQPLSEAFQRSGIPYQTVGQTPLTEHKDVRMILACLWFVFNPNITFQLEQIASKKQVQTIVSFLTAIDDNAITPVPVLIEQIQQFLANRSILSFAEKGSESLQQLQRQAAPFENRLGEFLESMALQKETDLYDPRADRVTLMTLHAAKGLEFPVVFMVGCEETLLPYQMEGKTVELEEERRLFYVGMTRAQQKLVLTHAKTRFLFGQRWKNEPSRFLSDIENTLKQIKTMARQKKVVEDQDGSTQLKLF